MDEPEAFYDALADDYHLIFKDWAGAVMWNGEVLAALIRHYGPQKAMPLSVLDCASGIGTQALGLAQQGYRVHATDISAAAIERAQAEAQTLGLSLSFSVADMRVLDQALDGSFDVVLAYDNALPHLLSDADLSQAAQALYAVTAPGGIFTASIRDYDALLQERPSLMSQRVLGADEQRRVSLQYWEWAGDHYSVTQFLLVRAGDDWQMRHYTTRYRALQRATLSAALERAGFVDVTWLLPAASGYYQPIVIARRVATS